MRAGSSRLTAPRAIRATVESVSFVSSAVPTSATLAGPPIRGDDSEFRQARDAR